MVRFDREREFVHIEREAKRRSQSVEDKEFAFSEVFAIGIRSVESFPEDELTFAIPEFVFASHALDVVRAHEEIRIVALQTANTRYVGAYGDMIVRDTLSRPNAAYFVGAFAQDFHLPHLLAVGDGNAFTAVAIAILLNKLANQFDGVACVIATHKSHTLKFLDQKHTLLVLQNIGASECSFAYGELLFVHARIGRVEVSVGMSHLGNSAGDGDTRSVIAISGMHGTFTNSMDSARLIVASRLHSHPSAVAAVTSVRSDDRAIGGGFFTHHDRGARLAIDNLRVVIVIVLSTDNSNREPS